MNGKLGLDIDGDPKSSFIGLFADLDGDTLCDDHPMTVIYFQPQLYISMLLLWDTRHLGLKRTNRNLKVKGVVEKLLLLQYLWGETKRSKTQFKKRNPRQVKKVLSKEGNYETVNQCAGYKLSEYRTGQQTLTQLVSLGINPEGIVPVPPVYHSKPLMPVWGTTLAQFGFIKG